jgi:hypothetical protein
MSSLNNKIIKQLNNTATTNQNLIITTIKENGNFSESMDDKDVLDIYNLCLSIRQKLVKTNGFNFEQFISKILTKNNIPFKSQIAIDKNGTIVKCGNKDTFHITDFVIGSKIKSGKHVSNFIVVSCKKTCRERWTQDNWTLTIKPKKFLLLTLSNDYPQSKRFNESSIRKIVTCKPKIKDDRTFTLNYDNFLDELHN